MKSTAPPRTGVRTAGDAARARTSFAEARILYSLIAPMGAMLVGLTEAGERIREIDERLSALGSEPGGTA